MSLAFRKDARVLIVTVAKLRKLGAPNCRLLFCVHASETSNLITFVAGP